jgi:hypothetical protein
MLRPGTGSRSQAGTANLLVVMVLMMSLTVVTLSVAHTQLLEQRVAGNQQWHTRLALRADAALARGHQVLLDAPHGLSWRRDPGVAGQVSRMSLDSGRPDIDTQVVFERREASPAFVFIRALAVRADGSGLQARSSRFVRPLSVLSPEGEVAPPLVLNGCPGPAGARLEIHPLNADLAEAGDAVWLNADRPCPPPPAIDAHGGGMRARPLGSDLWPLLFSIDRETFAAMASDQAELPDHERTYWQAQAANLIAGRWLQSAGTPEQPAVVYFPAETGCPEFAPGVRIYGVVFIDADCPHPVSTHSFELYGSLMINGDLNTGGTRLRLYHIQVSGAGESRLQFPALRSVEVPGSWSDF